MPVTYRIDVENGVVVTAASGSPTAQDILACRATMAADPDFSPDMKQLVDMTQLDKVLASSADLRQLAEADPFSTGALRAIVAESDVTFGVGRMYELLVEKPGAVVKVFRDISDARAWLGIETAERQCRTER